jgi:hypothetical protein
MVNQERAVLDSDLYHQVQRTLGLKMAAKPADEVRCTCLFGVAPPGPTHFELENGGKTGR